MQVGVECYGGGLWHTWFDRDLSLAGRVMVRGKDGSIEQKLVNLARPILRIPSLAVHLDRQTPFEFNKETQLFPIAGLAAAELDKRGSSAKDTEGKSEEQNDKATVAPLKAMTERHHPFILNLVAEEVGVGVEDVLDFELSLYDTQQACLGGVNGELVFSARLDNLGMSYCGTQGLINATKSPSENDSSIHLLSLFDHEEIGSLSAQGADSNMLPSVLHRLSVLPAATFEGNDSDDSYEGVAHDDGASAYEQMLSTSFLISADMAHAVNPNYSSKYESDSKCEMNKGTVIKINANQRYSTNSPGIVLLQQVAQRAQGGAVPLQLFVVRNDSMCGSTIGPMLAGKLGSRTLDLGNPQLSMHSIRETGGAHDVEHAIRLFSSFYAHYGELEPQILVD